LNFIKETKKKDEIRNKK